MMNKKQQSPLISEENKPGKPEKLPQKHEQASAQDSLGLRKNLSSASSNPLEKKKGPKTRIVIKYDVGFNNMIYLRGKGANLSWDKGICLKNTNPDEWVWETDSPFTACEFKVLINDKHYEIGENHPLTCGASIQYTPKFF